MLLQFLPQLCHLFLIFPITHDLFCRETFLELVKMEKEEKQYPQDLDLVESQLEHHQWKKMMSHLYLFHSIDLQFFYAKTIYS